MRASTLTATTTLLFALACPACTKKVAPEPVASTSDGGADAMTDARADGYPDDFPESIPSYPGATKVTAKKTLGLRLVPTWDVSFSTTAQPAEVALFYTKNMHGFRGSGTNNPNGNAESHWENAKYHMDMYATPIAPPGDGAAGGANVQLSVTWTRPPIAPPAASSASPGAAPSNK